MVIEVENKEFNILTLGRKLLHETGLLELGLCISHFCCW